MSLQIHSDTTSWMLDDPTSAYPPSDILLRSEAEWVLYREWNPKFCPIPGALLSGMCGYSMLL